MDDVQQSAIFVTPNMANGSCKFEKYHTNMPERFWFFFCSFGRDVRSFTEADEMNSRMPKSKCKKKKMKDNKIEFQAERRLFCHQHYIAFVVINTNNEWKKK